MPPGPHIGAKHGVVCMILEGPAGMRPLGAGGHRGVRGMAQVREGFTLEPEALCSTEGFMLPCGKVAAGLAVGLAVAAGLVVAAGLAVGLFGFMLPCEREEGGVGG